MLYKAEYLDVNTLDGYISTIEGGVRESETLRTVNGKDRSGKVNVGPVNGGVGSSSETESTFSFGDHQVSKLKRLIDAGHEDPESTGWVEVLEPDSAFSDIGLGALLEWECETYIPELSSLMANGKEISQTIRGFKSMLPFAASSGWDTANMPDSSSLEAMSSFLEKMDLSPVVVGEGYDTDWRVVGTLDKRWIVPGAQFEGPYKIVGKVRKTIGPKRWYPLLSLPGMNGLGRERRRQMERQGPKDPSEEGQFIAGPAVMLDILAIYR